MFKSFYLNPFDFSGKYCSRNSSSSKLPFLLLHFPAGNNKIALVAAATFRFRHNMIQRHFFVSQRLLTISTKFVIVPQEIPSTSGFDSRFLISESLSRLSMYAFSLKVVAPTTLPIFRWEDVIPFVITVPKLYCDAPSFTCNTHIRQFHEQPCCKWISFCCKSYATLPLFHE